MNAWVVLESTKVKGKHAPAGAQVELSDADAEPLREAGLIAPAEGAPVPGQKPAPVPASKPATAAKPKAAAGKK